MNADTLTALENWVEAGTAPQALIETRGTAENTATRPLCEWPRWYRYNGSGNPASVSSFDCVAS
ncbi:MAG: tannase/feruloyl esterase family alpha/beta hydrolase [Pigmentiphaga sp.]